MKLLRLTVLSLAAIAAFCSVACKSKGASSNTTTMADCVIRQVYKASDARTG